MTGGLSQAASAPPACVRLDTVDSTQSVAFALAAQGAVDGTVVVASFQSAGRGRRGRVWSAAPGEALLASFVLRPRLAHRDLPLLSYVAAVATADAIASFGATPRLKWPNDVLVDGRKISGILLESRLTPSDGAVVAIGVGWNLRQTTFPPELAAQATSLRIATGRDVTVDEALAVLRVALDEWRTVLEVHGFAPVRRRWLERADTIGRRVRVDDVEGVAVDLDPDGALVIEEHGARHRVVVGDVDAPRR